MTIQLISHRPTVAGRLDLRYRAEDTRVERVFFANRAAAEIGLTAGAGRITVGETTYRHNASATALTTADGRTWEPLVEDVAAYGTASAFRSRMTAIGRDFPTPFLTDPDPAPFHYTLRHIGCRASNLLADGANNTGAINDFISWASGKTNGATLHGADVFSTSTWPPAIALSAPIILLPKVNLSFGPSDRFRAAADMEAMLLSAADVRLERQYISGGYWDADKRATYAIRLKNFSRVLIGGNGFTAAEAIRACVGVGEPDVEAVFEFYLESFRIENRNNNPYGAQALAGIEFVAPVSDSRIKNGVIYGYPRGVSGRAFGSTIQAIHAWSNKAGSPSNPTPPGPLQFGVHLDGGGRTEIKDCQFDNPHTAGVLLASNAGDTGDFKVESCRFTSANDTGNAAPTVDSVSSVYLVRNTNGAKVQIVNCIGNDRSDARFAGIYEGGWSTVDICPRTHLRAGTPSRQEVRDGYPTTTVTFTTVPDAAPVIVASQNCTVTRTSDSDYTLTFIAPMRDTNYQVLHNITPTSYPMSTPLSTTIRTRNAGQLRVQFQNGAGAFVRPESVSLRLVGG